MILRFGDAVTDERRRVALVPFAVLALGVALIAMGSLEWAYGWFGPPGWRFNTGDLTLYQDATRSLLAGGPWYHARQISGPYPIAFGDILYPPVTALFFAPWLILPGWSFVLIPVAIVGWIVWTFRPAPWVWPLIGLCLLWPSTGIKVLSANPSIWVAAFVALGLRYRWPGALVLLKPSFLLLALIGIRSRGWWITVAVLAVLSLPFLAESLRYPTVVLDARSPEGFGYSIVDLPMVLIPIVAWAGRRRGRRLLRIALDPDGPRRDVARGVVEPDAGHGGRREIDPVSFDG